MNIIGYVDQYKFLHIHSNRTHIDCRLGSVFRPTVGSSNTLKTSRVHRTFTGLWSHLRPVISFLTPVSFQEVRLQ